MSAKRPKLFIGIDFGTTFTGIAWAIEGAGDDDMEVIKDWPGRGNSTSQKAPTIISYQNDEVRWGYQVDDMKEAIKGVKLLLDTSKETHYRSSYGPAKESSRILDEMRKKPVDVAGEYLGKLVAHLKFILDRRGIGSVMKTMDVQYILTVPAVWSDKAKDLTMQAAYLAGIPRGNLALLSEPEAAAVHAIRMIQPNSIENGDCFIVCDAGGGTVDLITYRTTQTRPLRMEEVTEGTGAICGSTKLDDAFQAFLVETLGKKYKYLSDQGRRVALRRWQDDVKPFFAGKDDQDGFLDTGSIVPLPGVPDIPDKQIYSGILHMPLDEIEKIFDPIVSQIESLVSEQEMKAIKAGYPPKAIILVGGFGSSEYLYKRLKASFEGIEIMQPRDAWSAVVRGAVLRGLEGNQVNNRIARAHYGIKHSSNFDPNRHKECEKEWCSWEETWNVHDQLTWYIKKGKPISENTPIKFPFYRLVDLNHNMLFKVKLKICFEEDAPGKKTRSVSSVCELESDLSRIPKSLFHLHTNSAGKKCYKVNYNLVLTPCSASMIFELEFNGISYGTVRASYL
ncbi:uncharacterized protein N7483_012669 [Penicillium malachiteum]|uniref:uncharacterized protein n=1 Tax=Penicillium malachiteum TaxID=1324776 RepID=UPI002549512D|nr:uncharacterized protein N7483_012669 [Penicillium malachiteum]KAJ5715488.1 hypothetical protein N7483_012669 [Penicillium malachiteum]